MYQWWLQKHSYVHQITVLIEYLAALTSESKYIIISIEHFEKVHSHKFELQIFKMMKSFKFAMTPVTFIAKSEIKQREHGYQSVAVNLVTYLVNKLLQSALNAVK